MKQALLTLIRLYQKTDFFRQPFFKALFMTDAVCRFRPTCSRYTYEAIEKYGSVKGLWMGLKRIVRCNPWNKGGYDPVP